jgi:hypothetical protein
MNIVLLIVQARGTIHSLDLNADYTTSFVLPALASHAAAGSVISLGAHAYYEAWWFDRATVGLPHYRFIWEAVPFVVDAAGIAVVVWCAWLALGLRGALVSGVVLVSISDGWRVVLADPSGRVGTAVHAGALLAALLIVSGARRAPRLNRSWLVALTVFTVAFGAAGGTDSLVAATVLVPYTLAPWAWWFADRSRAALRVSLYALATGIGALIGAVLLTAFEHSQHVLHAWFPVVFLATGNITGNLQAFAGDWANLGAGSFFGLAVNVTNLEFFVPGALCLTALGGVLWALWRRARSLATRPPMSGGISDPTRAIYLTFWGLVLAIDLGLWLLTQVSAEGATGGDNYLLSAWIATAALLGAFAVRRRLWWTVLAGVAVFSILNFRTHVDDGVPAYGYGPTAQIAGDIEHFTQTEGAKFGFTSYWDSTPIIWETHLKALAYPITNLSCTAASGLCPYFMGISSWYVPRRNIRTFLVTDSNPAVPGAFGTAPAALGKPLAVAPLGQYTVYVYDYDIASRFGPSQLP